MNCPICGNGYGHKAGCPSYDPMPEKVGECELCGDSIYRGDFIFDVDGKLYHDECLIDGCRCEA